ncbi:DUF4259 domain-containing protein [Actinoplanes subglobosus]|uniref:DUF4259 domain-containing protein n=1 Tax=Actinoplanes subglobosus TaxID=1547892 RepID=A0ABV8IGR5_9ACTN
MGAWGVGPFDNDDAADFAGGLDEASPGARIVYPLPTCAGSSNRRSRRRCSISSRLGGHGDPGHHEQSCRLADAVARTAGGGPVDAAGGDVPDPVRLRR